MLAFDLSRSAEKAGYEVLLASRTNLDITNRAEVHQFIESEKPNVVINTPGLSVDACEVDPEKGLRLHAWASSNVATQCERINATYVYISTCGLFGDEIKFYSEYDDVQLKTEYSRSKYKGEEMALRQCSRTFVIRPGWLFGGTPQHQRNFVCQRYYEALDKDKLSSASDKFGSPTCTVDLADKLLEILESEEYGTYHISNSGSASRYEYVKFIVDAFGLRTPVEPVDSSFYPRAAPVPNCEMISNLNVKFLGLNPMSCWSDALLRYVDSVRKII